MNFLWFLIGVIVTVLLLIGALVIFCAGMEAAKQEKHGPKNTNRYYNVKPNYIDNDQEVK